MATAGNIISEGEMDLLFTLANAKGIPSGPYSASNPWLSELTRLRQYIIATLGTLRTGEMVSGPWPLHFGSVFGDGFTPIGPADFYYAGSDDAEVSISQNIPVYSFDPDKPPIADVNTEISPKLIIGGTKDVRFRGRFRFTLWHPSADATGSVTTDFPGVTGWTYTPPGPIGLSTRTIYSNYIDVTVSPGVYEFTCTGTGGTYIHDQGLLNYFVSGDAVTWPTITADCDPAVEVNGIHSTEQCWRVKCTPPAPLTHDEIGGFPFGIWFMGYNPTRGFFWTSGGTAFSADREGWWVAKTGPVAALPQRTGYMPWNKLDAYGVPVSVDPAVNPQDTIYEQRTQPLFTTQFTWAGSTAIKQGRWLVRNNLYMICDGAGTTGGSEPTWPTEAGGGVNDGSAHWKAYNYSGVVARVVSQPVYPVKKDGDSIIYTPEALPYWSQFHSGWQNLSSPIYGVIWWIRRVRINRIRSASADMNDLGGDDSPINVTLGCIRDGSFVAFGTWPTGSWVTVDTGEVNEDEEPIYTDHLLWPIFTRDSLVYQASERVDVQAEFIGGIPSFGHTVGFPVMAHHYNDTMALLLKVV